MKTNKNLTISIFSILFLLAAVGCDSADPGADEELPVDGLWQAEADATIYLNVTANQVSSYEFLPDGTVNDDVACYFVQPFTVVRIDGDTYTLRDTVLDFEFTVTMTRRNDVLTTVMTVDGSANTVRYGRSDKTLSQLSPACG